MFTVFWQKMLEEKLTAPSRDNLVIPKDLVQTRGAGELVRAQIEVPRSKITAIERESRPLFTAP